MSSNTPDGEYLPTYASNLLMDGFDFDSEYGEGPNSARKDPSLPQSQGHLSALPDGLITGKSAAAAEIELVDEGFGDLDMGAGTPMLTDLSWLEEAEQDPDRLPESPNSAVLDGLVEAWGVHRRTDGRRVTPHVRPPPPPKSTVSSLPGDQLRSIVASAMRRSAAGETMDSVLSAVVGAIGDRVLHVKTDPTLQKLARAIRSVENEHGVHGTIYLRETAFPGILTKKWDKVIKHRWASVPYWLVTPGSKLAAYENYLGKKVVTEIPWGEALGHFRPLLNATGRTAGEGDPKMVLLAALATRAKTNTVVKGRQDVSQPKAASVDLETAKRMLREAPQAVRALVSREDPKPRLAQQQIARWVRAGLLSKADGSTILRSGEAPKKMVDTAARKITASGRKPTYMGSGSGMDTHRAMSTRGPEWGKRGTEEALTSLRNRVLVGLDRYVARGLLTASERERIASSGLSPKEMLRVAAVRAQDPSRSVPLPKVERVAYSGAAYKANNRVSTPTPAVEIKNQETQAADSLKVKVTASIQKMVKAGSLSDKDASRILSSKLSPREMMRVAEARVMSPAKEEIKATKTAAYSDVQYTQHAPTHQPKDGESPLEVRAILRWASVKMSEGAAGKPFDDFINLRFSRELVASAEPQLVQLRKKHEGLSGHLYVDASAYASPTGTSGCEKGALTHRANAIPTVLQMSRCGSCVFNVDGNCQKYSKPLVASAPTSNPEAYQRETLKVANGEVDRTASLFAPTNYGAEYGLENDVLDSIDTLPTNEKMGEILFGDNLDMGV